MSKELLSPFYIQKNKKQRCDTFAKVTQQVGIRAMTET